MSLKKLITLSVAVALSLGLAGPQVFAENDKNISQAKDDVVYEKSDSFVNSVTTTTYGEVQYIPDKYFPKQQKPGGVQPMFIPAAAEREAAEEKSYQDAKQRGVPAGKHSSKYPPFNKLNANGKPRSSEDLYDSKGLKQRRFMIRMVMQMKTLIMIIPMQMARTPFHIVING
jgi:hypothetical protein